MYFAVADADGKCVAVEYLNSEIVVTETPVVTNFYFAEGDKNGKGTQQSHERYEILMRLLSETEYFTADDVMNALDGYMRKILKLNGLCNIGFKINTVSAISADRETGKHGRSFLKKDGCLMQHKEE